MVSGEQAESKSIASKVKSKIDECEIFVGLFTADKPVFEKKKILFGFSKFDVNSYTTSNWVLQELGYAVGKNKHVIVITEKKLHRFPNLHSDDTHVIEFNRDSLELAFQGISEMIKSIEKENKKDQFTIGIQSQDELQPLDKISEIKSEKEKDNASDQETMIFLDMIIALDSKEYSKARDVYEKNSSQL